MNKKLIALAVGAALAAPLVAQADVTVYGRAQAELANVKTEVGSTSTTVRGLVDNAMGRVGIKASEDLGDGLTGFAKFEFKADTITNTAATKGGGNGALSGRDSFVGIKGGFGAVSFGRHAGAYKDTNLDPYIATTLEARNGFGQSSGAFGHASFINDTIKYVNKFGNVKFEALMTAGNDKNGDNGDYQLAVDYKGGPLRAIVAYSKNKEATAAKEDEKRTKLAGQYSVGPHKFTAQIEKLKHYTPSGTTDLGDVDMYMLMYNLKMANKNTLTAKIAQEKYKTGVSYKNKIYMVALNHMFSKTFRVFGGYQQAKTDAAVETKISIFTVGMRKDF